MGYDLQRWALTEQHPCLTPRTRQVLVAISMVAHDDHGEFWMRSNRFLAEYLPDLSHAAYRNHLSILVRNGLLIKLEHGGGRISGGRGKSSRYRVNAPYVTPQQPPQGVLPEITRPPEAPPHNPETLEQPHTIDASAAHRRLDEMLAAGVTPAQVLAILDFTAETLLASSEIDRENGQIEHETRKTEQETCKEILQVSDKHASRADMFQTNMQADVACLSEETCKETEKHARRSDRFLRNMQEIADPTPIHEEKRGEYKKAAAARNMQDPDSELTASARDDPDNFNDPQASADFFAILADKLTDAGHRGIRPAQFEHLRQLLPQYASATDGVLPDEATADYIVGRLTASSGIRNVAGFVLAITEDVLRTGEGYEEPQPDRAPPPSQPEPDSVPEPPDWELLHLAHIEQTAPARELWAATLEKVRPEVARPAFETWLSDTTGWAYAQNTFVVCTHNAFITEMLANRLHPIIERSVRDVTGEVLTIKYAVKAQDNETCAVCQHANEVSTAAS